MNNIINNQNTDKFVRLLKAQSIAYSKSKRYQVIDVTGLIFAAVPPILLLFDLNSSNLVATVGVGLTVLTILSDIWRKRDNKAGAVIQEEFDTKLFEMEWNPILVGARIDQDKIISLCKEYKGSYKPNWYSVAIKEHLPQPIAVLLCHKNTSIWSKQQRKGFVDMLFWVLGLYYGLLILLCVFKNTGFFDATVWIAPSLPFLVYGATTIKNQTEIINEYTRIGIIIDNLLDIYKQSKTPPDKTTLRQIQDLFYSQRIIPYKVPDWYYYLNNENTNNLTDEILKSIVDELN